MGGLKCFSTKITTAVIQLTAAKTWLILPLGAAAFLVFYGVFRLAIQKWDLKTPGREENIPQKQTVSENQYTETAKMLLEALGGKENIAELTHCITRLRLEVKDPALVDESKIQAHAAGLIRPTKTTLQIVIGPKVQFLYEALRNLAE